MPSSRLAAALASGALAGCGSDSGSDRLVVARAAEVGIAAHGVVEPGECPPARDRLTDALEELLIIERFENRFVVVDRPCRRARPGVIRLNPSRMSPACTCSAGSVAKRASQRRSFPPSNWRQAPTA